MSKMAASNRIANGLAYATKQADARLAFDPTALKYDPDVTYPEVKVGLGVTIQIMWITPEIAQFFLSEMNDAQRTLKTRHLRSIVEDIRAGRFAFNGETIGIDSNGKLFNGQHRCTAIVETGIPILSLVVRGIRPEAYPTVDIISKRTGADALRSSGIVNANIVSGAAVILETYKRGEIGKQKVVLSPIAIDEIVRANPGLAESAHILHRHKVLTHRPSAMTFCHYILSSITPEVANQFFDKLASGADMQKGNPILTLRNKFIGDKYTPEQVIELVFVAWNHWRRGQTRVALRISEGSELPKPI